MGGHRRRAAGLAASLAFVCAVGAADAAGQEASPSTRAPKPPAPEPRSSEPFRPPAGFRSRGFDGALVEAATFEQPECPLVLEVTSLTRDRTLTVTLRLSNIGEKPMTKQVLGAWVFMPDGTVRGYQRQDVEQTLDAGGSRSIDFVLRTANAVPGDLVIVAVQEAVGERPWRRNVKDLDKDIREALRAQ